MQSPLQDLKTEILALDPFSQLLKATYKDRNRTRNGSSSKSFFPFRLVVGGRGAVEWDRVLRNSIVKVVTEGSIGGEGVPFGESELDLFCYWLRAYGTTEYR